MKGETQMKNSVDVLRKIADVLEQLPERKRRLSIKLDAIDGDRVLMLNGNLRDVLELTKQDGKIFPNNELSEVFPLMREVYVDGIRFYDYYKTLEDAEIAK